MMAEIALEKAVVLAVDDEQSILAELKETLGKEDYLCHTCSSMESALAKAQEIKPDLIISDINLEGQSGLDLCEQLRQIDGLEDVPLLFLSGAQIPDVIRRAHAAGGTYYLRKPFDPGVLLELVDKALWMPHLVRNRSSQATVG